MLTTSYKAGMKKRQQKMGVLLLLGTLALTMKMNITAAESAGGEVTVEAVSESQLKRQPRSEAVVINAVNFPDENFRNYVIEEFDNNDDGELSEEERNNVTFINVHNMTIGDLTGIEFFLKLENLICTSNQLTALDVSQNKKLMSLYCGGNQLTALDVSQNKELYGLYCGDNQLTALDVSQNKKLMSLFCGDNQLSTLNISQNKELSELSCYNNQLSDLDVSKNKALVLLECSYNKLTSITNMTSLENLYHEMTTFEYNHLTEQELRTKLPAHLVSNTAWLVRQIKSQEAAETDDGKGAGGGKGTPKAPVAAPPAPTNVSAITPSRKSATISWKKVTGAVGYEVHRSTNKSTGFRQVANLVANATSFTDSSLAEGRTYYYKVRAKNATGYKDSSVITVRTVAKATALRLKKSGNRLRISYKSTEKRFQIQVSRKKKSGYKNVATNHKKKSLTVNNSKIRKVLKLKKGRTYTVYVRVRSFRTVNNKRVYSSWTAPRRVKKLNMK